MFFSANNAVTGKVTTIFTAAILLLFLVSGCTGKSHEKNSAPVIYTQGTPQVITAAAPISKPETSMPDPLPESNPTNKAPGFIFMSPEASGPGSLTHAGDNLKTCEDNLGKIGEALEGHSKDNNGKYPETLGLLIPRYIAEIPSCPVSGTDTYSISYQVSDERDSYTFYCSGHNHQNLHIPANYPQYSSKDGLMEIAKEPVEPSEPLRKAEQDKEEGNPPMEEKLDENEK